MMMRHSACTKGFSLVELMISMVLGIVIVGGCISIFTGVVRSSSLNQTVSNLQSNARFALDIIGRDVRAAGFLGCASERNVALNITISNPPTTNLSETAVTGYVVGESAWQPALPTAYTAPAGIGKPVPGTHALSVQYAQFPGEVLESSMSTTTSAVVIAKNSDEQYRTGQLMVLSDCSSADLFSTSSITQSDTEVTLSHGTSLGKTYTVSAEFPESVRVMPFISTIYYIGDTQRTSEAGDTVYSLYAHSYPYVAANPPLELIEGVDQLVLEFGVRQADGTLRYATPDSAAYNGRGVETVRVGLLMSSLERFAQVDTARAYTLAGQSVSAQGPATAGEEEETAPAAGAGSLTYISDQRMRIPFNATFNVRNRNL